MFKNQISHKALIFLLCWHTRHWVCIQQQKSVRPTFFRWIYSAVYPRPHYTLLSPGPWRNISCHYIWAVGFSRPAVYSFMWPSLPRRHLNLLPSFTWSIWRIYMLSLLMYFNSCLPLYFLFVPQFLSVLSLFLSFLDWLKF